MRVASRARCAAQLSPGSGRRTAAGPTRSTTAAATFRSSNALDTVGDKAVCVFLPQLEDLDGREIAKASIATGPEPGTISVIGREDQGSPELARVDTTTFAVTAPVPEGDESGSGLTAPLILAGLALAGFGFGLFLVRRHRRTAARAAI